MSEQQEPKCSFCGRKKSEVSVLLAGYGGAHICDACVEQAEVIIKEENKRSDRDRPLKALKPERSRNTLINTLLARKRRKK